jgi:metal-responsive CopG/Arc/MetJ family transcriptional regulator
MTKTIKTAVSIQKSVFDQAEILAQQLNVSRSGLFELAVEDFIKRHQSESLLNEINAAYSDQSDINEQKHLAQMRKSHRRLVEGEW